MKKIVFRYGLISGAISAALVLATGAAIASKILNFGGSEVVGYISMMLAFSVIYPGMIAYRDNIGGGEIKYGRAFAIGMLITAISCVLYVVAWVIVYHTMLPGFWDQYAAYAVAEKKSKGGSAADIDKIMDEMKQMKELYKSPVAMCLLAYIEPLPVGLLISIISAFLVRLKRDG